MRKTSDNKNSQGGYMNRQVICSICEKEWNLRSGGMAYQSLNRHINTEHREETK